MFLVLVAIEEVRKLIVMLERRGTGRGLALVGRGVYNQRVERLWRDGFTDFLELNSIGSLRQ